MHMQSEEFNIPPAVLDLLTEVEEAGFDVTVQADLHRMLAERPELATRLAAAMEPYKPAVLQTLIDFIDTETWEDSRQHLEAHPDLLGDEADALLAEMIEAAETRGEEDDLAVFLGHRHLLQRVREIGVDAAYQELMEEEEERIDESKAKAAVDALMAAIKTLPEAQQEAFFDIVSGAEGPEDAWEALKDHPELMQIVREAIEQNFAFPDNE